MPTFDKDFKSIPHAGGRIRKTASGKFAAERSDGGRIRRHTCETIAEAKRWLSNLGARRDAQGKIATALTAAQTRDALDSFSTLASAGLDVKLKHAVDYYVSHHQRHEIDWTFTKALSLHLRDMEQPHDATEPARPETVKSKRRMLKSFENLYGQKSIRSITRSEVDLWVESFGDVAPKTRLNRTLALQSIFNWAEIHLPGFRNEAALFPTGGRRRKKAVVKLMTPEQAESVMRYFEEHALPRYTATMALLLFGGLRPYELLRSDSQMTWRQIDLDVGKIEILGTESKTGHSRTVPISQNLKEWLSRYKGRGRIAPAKSRFGSLRRAACASAGVEWVNDMPRHSFASYAGEKYGHHLAAQWLGHTSGLSMYLSHYKGRSTLEEAERYFRICPHPMKK